MDIINNFWEAAHARVKETSKERIDFSKVGSCMLWAKERLITETETETKTEK